MTPTFNGMSKIDIPSLKDGIEALSSGNIDEADRGDADAVLGTFLDGLEAGTIRAATPGEDGRWTVHSWVKSGILLAFRMGGMTSFENGLFSYADRDLLTPRRFMEEERVRLVPGGSAVRRGAHLGAGTVCMPPSYVNVGAFVDQNTMVDSHVLVGSCAQIGAGVHLSAAAQIGGVLEPAGALPVIVEDGVFIGGGCGIYEGCIVGRGAVLAPGVTLSGSTPIYDLVREEMIRAEENQSLEIPAGAVVVPGSRPASTTFAQANGVSLYAAVIVKYRNASTEAATRLEELLRTHHL